MRLIVLAVFYIVLFSVFGQHDELFLFTENNKYGYFNSKREVIIPAKYIAAGNFSDGLAPVRLNGTYGYIDTLGNYAIESKYDYTECFSHGLAKVFLNGRSFLIDTKGQRIFNNSYCQVNRTNKNLFYVKTASSKEGVLNLKGDLVVDTLDWRIGYFQDGYAVVSKDNQEGIIDTLGNIVLEFGKFNEIYLMDYGYASAYSTIQNEYKSVLIDKHGNVIFEEASECFNNSFVLSPDRIMIQECNSGITVLNKKGEVVFSNPNWDYVSKVTGNFAFSHDTTNQWHLIDKQGNTISNQSFSKVEIITGNENSLIKDYFAFVKLGNYWGSIDTFGNYTSLPNGNKFDDIVYIGDNLAQVSIWKKDKYYKSGLIDFSTNQFFAPKYSGFYTSNLTNINFTLIDLDTHFGYVNHKGKLLWKGKKVVSGSDIDFMRLSIYPVASKKTSYSKREELPKLVSKKYNFQDNKIQLIIDTTQLTKWNRYKLFLANTTNNKASFGCIDGLLYIKIQALDKNGVWRDIEYMYNARCGNSYYHKSLEPCYFWELSTPIYKGEFKTKLRAELSQVSTNSNEKITVYSNEIDGYVNPGQMWSKKDERLPINYLDY